MIANSVYLLLITNGNQRSLHEHRKYLVFITREVTVELPVSLALYEIKNSKTNNILQFT